MRRPPRHRRSDSGFALIALLALVMAGVMYFVVGQLDSAAVQRKRNDATTLALAQAKEALIGRAITDNNRPGSFPCPDSDGNGNADAFTGPDCPNYIGWLPWRTLGIGDIRDGNGEHLWYAFSSTLKDHASAEPINQTRPMTITLNGVFVAAIIFAPGAHLPGQARPSNLAGDYLDGSNADGDIAYVALPASATFNDQVLSVTSNELFDRVAYRVAAEIRGDPSNGLDRYFQNSGIPALPYAATTPSGNEAPPVLNGYIPYADLMYPGSSWLHNNNWFDLAQYQRTSATTCTISIGTRSFAFSFH
jgi:hypothetical protein